MKENYKEKIESLLDKTSRTFAVSIPLLEDPRQTEIGIAYLLFRIVDTVEDSYKTPIHVRISYLDKIVTDLLSNRNESINFNDLEVENPYYLELLKKYTFIKSVLFQIDIKVREIIIEHIIRTALGMKRILLLSKNNRIVVSSIDDLLDYCYIVAGIVGEMLTKIFLLDKKSKNREELLSLAPLFGRALQLVNILKDSLVDKAEGRVFLPETLHAGEVIKVTKSALHAAERHVFLLWQERFPRDVIKFCAFPLNLAWLSLEKVISDGPGAKISREDVLKTREWVISKVYNGEIPLKQY